RVLEADPTFNAGYGSALNSDGEVEMCAGWMEGRDLNVGAVAVIKGVRHPIVSRTPCCMRSQSCWHRRGPGVVPG
ncbi:isoaspartyl peptidase/L-asparaginase, partial [Mesorhizobium australicum]